MSANNPGIVQGIVNDIEGNQRRPANAAPSNSPAPTQDDILVLIGDIKGRIQSSMDQSSSMVSNIMTPLTSAIESIKLVIADLNKSIDILIKKHNTTTDGSTKLMQEIDKLKANRDEIKRALTDMENAYKQSQQQLNTNLNKMKDLEASVETSIKTPLVDLAKRVDENINSGPAMLGGYNWRKSRKSATKKSKSKKSRSNTKKHKSR